MRTFETRRNAPRRPFSRLREKLGARRLARIIGIVEIAVIARARLARARLSRPGERDVTDQGVATTTARYRRNSTGRPSGFCASTWNSPMNPDSKPRRAVRR
jgi:hypothetical protein